MTNSQSQPTVETNNLESASVAKVDSLPFAFARRFGVLVKESDMESLSLVCRSTPSIPVLLEIQRHFQKTIKTQAVEGDAFDSLLQQNYENQSQQQGMESFDDELDLSGVAEALPEPEDLLDAEDDAPEPGVDYLPARPRR